MVYRYSNSNNRTDFIFTGNMPEDNNIAYSRKGGCFVSICRGISIAVLIFVFIFFMSFTIFFSTKYAYEHKPNLTLEDFLNHRAYLIDKRARIPKHVIPKHYRLFIQPTFNDTENPFSYNGIVWITITSKKHNNKRIELNVKNLDIKFDDVVVLKSIRLTNLDFDEDLDWDLSEEDLYSRPRRRRRQAGDDLEEVAVETTSASDNDLTSTPPNLEIPSSIDPFLETISEGESEGGEEIDEVTTESTSENSTAIDKSKFYHHPIFPPDDFVTIKITDLEFDEPNEKMIIYLGTEMKKDIYYIVKINFTGKMTNDKGLYYTHFEDNDDETKHFSATILEPNNARRLFPCMDDHNFRSPFEINIARKTNMNTVSSLSLEMTEPMEDGDKIVDTFNTTAAIRAAEIGFVVTDMTPKTHEIRSNLNIIFYTRDKYAEHIQHIILIFSKIIHIYEDYMKLHYPYETIKYVTIPNVGKNVHEIKEGMILSSEKRIITDTNYFPSTDIDIDKEISFELANNWIHNLVDYKNKEQYWLHESIPLYLQIIALKNMNLHANYLENFLLQGRLRAMREEVNAKTSALNLFTNYWEDESYYELMKYKGLSVLRMMNYTLTESHFDNFIHQYFARRMNNESIDIFEILNSGVNKTDANFNSFIQSWTNMEKYPIIEIKRNNITGHFELKQVTYPFAEEVADMLWTVPITFINDTNQKLFMQKVRWLSDTNNILTIESSCESINNNTWIIVNPTGIGYYRVNYEEEQWINLAHVLNSNFTIIPYTTQTILIDDALNLARFGLLNYTIAFNIVSYLKHNDEFYQPWKTALSNLKFIYYATEDLPIFNYVEKFMEDIIVQKYEKITSSAHEGSKENEKIKFLVTKWACRLGITSCIEDRKSKFHQLFIDGSLGKFQQSENELLLTTCTTIKYSGFYEWNIVLQNLLNTTDIIYQKILLKSLGCTREISLIKTYLDLLKQDRFSIYANEILTSISNNKIALKYTLDFLYNDWIEIRKYLSLRQISTLFKNISSENEFSMYEQIFYKYSYTFQQMDKELLKRMRDTIMKLLRWKKDIGPTVFYEPFIFNATLAE